MNNNIFVEMIVRHAEKPPYFAVYYLKEGGEKYVLSLANTIDEAYSLKENFIRAFSCKFVGEE